MEFAPITADLKLFTAALPILTNPPPTSLTLVPSPPVASSTTFSAPSEALPASSADLPISLAASATPSTPASVFLACLSTPFSAACNSSTEDTLCCMPSISNIILTSSAMFININYYFVELLETVHFIITTWKCGVIIK